jgi:NAD(P)-dependent dehydrogenase (short-subunit alcohol dehydrogenase family)
MQQVDKAGSIVAIASIAGIRVAARAAAYAASKAGIIHLTKVLAYEWAPHGIRVNAIAPGYFETEMTQDLLATERGKAVIGRIPMGRVGQVTDLDGPLMLLASDASSYMTGTVIAVDGGHLVSTL